MKRPVKTRREPVQSLTTQQLARTIAGAVQLNPLYIGSDTGGDNPLFG